MTLFDYQCSTSQGHPAETGRILDFYSTRAGRAVAAAAVIGIGIADVGRTDAFVWHDRTAATTTELAQIIGPSGPWHDDAQLLFSQSDAAADTVTMSANESDADDLVMWFKEQQVEAEDSMRLRAKTPAVSDQDNQEVMLTRQNGSRAKQSWRGGGTMHRR
jgi:hypothetical protein